MKGGAAAGGWQTRSRIQINGGISLRPAEFTIKKNPESKALREFKRQAQAATVAAGGAGAKGGGGRLVRSRPTAKAAPAPARRVPAKPAAAAAPTARPAPAAKSAPAASPAAKTATPPKPSAPARSPSMVASRIAVPAGTAGAAKAVGELAADGRIVFRKAP